MNFLLFNGLSTFYQNTEKLTCKSWKNIISQKNYKIANMTSPFQNGQTGERVYSN